MQTWTSRRKRLHSDSIGVAGWRALFSTISLTLNYLLVACKSSRSHGSRLGHHVRGVRFPARAYSTQTQRRVLTSPPRHPGHEEEPRDRGGEVAARPRRCWLVAGGHNDAPVSAAPNDALRPRGAVVADAPSAPQPVREAWSTGAEVAGAPWQTRRPPPAGATSPLHGPGVPLVCNTPYRWVRLMGAHHTKN